MSDDPTAPADAGEALLEAALIHVPFAGWSDAALRDAIRETGTEPALARALFPRGGLDLALAFHERCDREMLSRLEATDLSALRFRDRIATAVRLRLEVIGEPELLRRAMTLFALPRNAADGARAVWNTVDLIWNTLGDSDDDVNWYTKRASLSTVYSATALFWLGDASPGHVRTWAFLDRRIDEVLRFESLKARMNANPFLKPFLLVPNAIGARIRPPASARRPTDPSAHFRHQGEA